MYYEAAITSFGGDETTLFKSFIISLENTIANWYARLPPEIYHIVGTTQGEIPSLLPGFPSRC
jgi:hypothetical protein